MGARLTAAARAGVAVGSGLAALGTAHALANLATWRRPPRQARVDEPVSVLVPMRDEAGNARACVTALLAQRGVPDLEVLVLDDGSTDGTAAAVAAAAAGDPRLRLIDGTDAPPPPGWLGKTWACHRLAAAAGGRVLVFVDADVRLAPDGLAATVALLRAAGLDLVSPYPRQEAVSAAERLVQPLLQWSFLTTLPLRAAERSVRPSLTAANGQLLAVDAAVYTAAGGHAGVAGAVLDDIALARAVKSAGGRAGVADGTAVATCRMYTGWPQLRAGYTKSLWAAFGSPAGAAGVVAVLVLAYVVPPLAAVAGSPVGAAGYAAAVLGRAAVARRVGGRVWPDAAAHPASVAAFAGLTLTSLRAARTGRLEWKGRAVPAGGRRR